MGLQQEMEIASGKCNEGEWGSNLAHNPGYNLMMRSTLSHIFYYYCGATSTFGFYLRENVTFLRQRPLLVKAG